MERIRTTELAGHAGQRIRIAGWLHALRRLGGLDFLVIRDGWGWAQVVAEGASARGALDGLGLETVLAIEGVVYAAPAAPGGFELREPRIEVISPVSEPLPISISRSQLGASLPLILNHAVLTTRQPARRAIFRLAAHALGGFRATLDARGFTELQSPKLVAEATESGASVFALDYFGQTAYLAQSPQFYKQIMVGVFERVYEVGPVFRAEPHDTPRHLNEYVSLDAEMGFITDHRDIMALLRDVVAGMLDAMRAGGAPELALLGVALPEVPVAIPAIDFCAARELIYRRTGVDERAELDLSPFGERTLGAWAREEHGSDWLYVTGYPTAKRAFYTAPDPERPTSTNAFDLLLRGVELVSGGQRLHRYADYVAKLEGLGLPLAPFAALLEAMRWGMPPHGGFGLGLERLLMQCTGIRNIKLVSLFPRDLRRLTP